MNKKRGFQLSSSKMSMIRMLPVLTLLPFTTSTLAQEPEQIVVVGVVPSGAGIDRTKIPFPVQSANAAGLEDANAVGIADFLRQGFSSINLNDAQNNPLQPDLQYRGFTASPLLGLAQGLAVYQNGVRINEPLGDSVNWDLLPQSAIQSITLAGGSNPLFGLNSLGGALAIDMKDGFTFDGASIELNTGSFGRNTGNIEMGDNDGTFAYYGNLEFFEEDGWRDASNSEAINFYGSVGWRSEISQLNVNYQYGDSKLIGNGASPVELLALDREALFTGPDITENDMQMLSLDFNHDISANISFGGNIFYRKNKTDSLNGDGSEFAVCAFGGMDQLIEGLEDDDLAELGLDDDDICDSQFADSDGLENFLNLTAALAGEEEEFNIQSFEGELSGTGLLSDEAINNLSNRTQESTGADFQWTLRGDFLGYSSQLIAGGAYFKGESNFNSVLELSELDPITRLTLGLGLGTFVDEQATSINAETESSSLYFTNTMDLRANVALTISARANNTDVNLRDKSGERPELNGSHNFFRINPAIGITWQASEDHNFYASYSESSRAPTPIELACNEGVFELAVAYAIEDGEDPEDVELECRLPNAFLADPPLDDVIAKSFELGARGFIGEVSYSVGLFQTSNTDDILFQTTGRSTGLFANVDETRRAGFESNLRGQYGNLDWMLAYSFVDATFEDNFQVLSPNHDFADDEGEVSVRRGDRIPGIPQNQFKLVADYKFGGGLVLGLDVLKNDEQFIRGDESNQLDEVDGYTVVNLRARYAVNEKFEIFAKVENLFDREFETFGLLGEEPGEVEVPIIEDMTIPIFLGAAPPRAGFIGIRYSF
ncbi:MAG: TonB-dependent receptor [Gammaproteobacteria bacterium]|jgi:iron complex outermembrane recepter protein|nr:TonB-dependent receptor [Gammaproteobacteria bacterium]MBT4581823.1 TonB-dependent receptor [Gammaproteobacteria bacterium]MBT4659683.1 TonB-dependent receptor [Gammaproteobacteria bacterium]MBT5512197.1 TonB-dependent receptor [Gammaproteobacteria bacterium]